MRIESVSFEGHESVRLRDGGVVVTVTTSVGPRILELARHEGNLLAVLPHAELERPDGGRLRLLGGHRLWAAPEIPEITYLSDEQPCQIAEVDRGVRVEAPPDEAGLVKALEVRRGSEGWIVDHGVRNVSETTMTIALWGITQLRLGGEVELPLGPRGSGPQADRSLVVWPYTDLADPRLRFERDALRIEAEPGGSPLKVGAAPGDGRVSYRLGRELFRKRTSVDPDASYADRGAPTQVYLCDDFCELETLGPLRVLGPGEGAEHRELWTLADAEDGT